VGFSGDSRVQGNNPAAPDGLLVRELHADTATGSSALRARQFEFFQVDSPLTVRSTGRPEQN